MFPELLSALGAQTESWLPQPGATVQRAFLRTEGELPTTRPEKDTLETMLCIDGQVDLRLADGQVRSVFPGVVLLCGANASISALTLPQQHATVYTAVIPLDRLQTYFTESTGAEHSAALTASLQESLSSGCRVLHGSDWYASVTGILSRLETERRGNYLLLRLLERLWLAAEERPMPVQDPSISETQVDIVRRVRRFLLDHMDSRLTIERLAEEFRISPTYLKETFRRVSGQPIHRYLQDCRLTRAARLLSTTNDSVLSIAVSVGYSGTSRFNAAFKERYGVNPRQFRQNAVK